MSTTASIGERLRIFLDKSVPDRNDYQNILGQSKGSIYNYMSNAHKPGAILIERLIGLRCNINWLFTGNGRMMIEEGKKGKDKREDAKKILSEIIKSMEKLSYNIEKLEILLDNDK